MELFIYCVCWFIALVFCLFIIWLITTIAEKRIIQIIKEKRRTEMYVEMLEKENRSLKRTIDHIRFENLKAETKESTL